MHSSKRKYSSDRSNRRPSKRHRDDNYNSGSSSKRKYSGDGRSRRPSKRGRVENKKMWNFEQPWDIKLTSLVSIRRTPPHPKMELERSRKITQLRRLYSNQCLEHVFVSPPDDNFNRWLFEQLSVPLDKRTTSDPLLTYPAIATDSLVLRRELEKEIPSSLYLKWRERDIRGAHRDVLKRYCSQGYRWLTKIREYSESQTLQKDANTSEDTPSTNDDKITANLSILRKKLNEIEDFLETSFSLEEIKARMDIVKQEVTPLFADTANPLITLVLSRLTEAAIIAAKELQDMDPNSTERVKLDVNNESCVIKFEDDRREISINHYKKLLKLYELNSAEEDADLEHFADRLYILLRRYETFFGPEGGVTFHAAAPEAVFECLVENFSVCQENFASPLNCYFKRFNSAFADTDVYFGSCGSFFDYTPEEGSFETGPPYTEEVMHNMALRLEILLEQSTLPLSFVVFVPNWQEPPSPGLVVMDESQWKRACFVIAGREHKYVMGDQHRAGAERYFVLPFATRVYILQNKAGAEKWPVTDEKLAKLKASLKDINV
eukprot:TRINITY_DN3664_c0_g1_i1.p1 TRINITY_DN3664_c0_g1~~TRINITY_DN3664_c0_g1_i1.p1  ORF type:complete len:549 (+),score=65.82 TRINITY_DN3664_c0_g1_i1:38-1684(+)